MHEEQPCEKHFVEDETRERSARETELRNNVSPTGELRLVPQTTDSFDDRCVSPVIDPSDVVQHSQLSDIQPHESTFHEGRKKDSSRLSYEANDLQEARSGWQEPVSPSNDDLRSLEVHPTPNEDVLPLCFAPPPPTSTLRLENDLLPASTDAAVRSTTSRLLSPRVWKEQYFWPNDYTTTQCLCLMRYWIRELAPWVCVSQALRNIPS